MFIISVCGTGLFDEVTATVCADMGVLGTVTNLTSLGGVFNWGVPGIGGPDVPIATVLFHIQQLKQHSVQ